MALDPGIGLAPWQKPAPRMPSKDPMTMPSMAMGDVLGQAALRLEGAFDYITKRMDAHEKIFYDLAGGNTSKRLNDRRTSGGLSGGRRSMVSRRLSSKNLVADSKVTSRSGTKSPQEKSPSPSPEGAKEGERELDLSEVAPVPDESPKDVSGDGEQTTSPQASDPADPPGPADAGGDSPEKSANAADGGGADVGALDAQSADAVKSAGGLLVSPEPEAVEDHPSYATWTRMQGKNRIWLGDLPEEFSQVLDRIEQVEAAQKMMSTMATVQETLTSRIISLEMSRDSGPPAEQEKGESRAGSKGNVDWISDIRAMVDKKLEAFEETLSATMKEDLLQELEEKVKETMDAIREEEAKLPDEDPSLSDAAREERRQQRLQERAQTEMANSMQQELTDIQIKLGELAKMQIKIGNCETEIQSHAETLSRLNENAEKQAADLSAKIDNVQAKRQASKELSDSLQKGDIGTLVERIDAADDFAQQLKVDLSSLQQLVEDHKNDKEERFAEFKQALGEGQFNASAGDSNQLLEQLRQEKKEGEEFLHQRLDDLQAELRKANKQRALENAAAVSAPPDLRPPVTVNVDAGAILGHGFHGDLSAEVHRIGVEVAGLMAQAGQNAHHRAQIEQMVHSVEGDLSDRLDGFDQRLGIMNAALGGGVTGPASVMDGKHELPSFHRNEQSEKSEKTMAMIRSVESRLDKVADAQIQQRDKLEVFQTDLEKMHRDMLQKILEKIGPLLGAGGGENKSSWSTVSDNASVGELGMFRLEFDSFKDEFRKEVEKKKEMKDRLYRLEDQMDPIKDSIKAVDTRCDSIQKDLSPMPMRISMVETRTDQEATKIDRLQKQLQIVISSQNQQPAPKAKSRASNQRASEGPPGMVQQRASPDFTSRELDLGPVAPVEAVVDGKTMVRLQQAEMDLQQQAKSTEELKTKLQEELDKVRSTMNEDQNRWQEAVKALKRQASTDESNTSIHLKNLDQDVGRLKHDVMKMKDLEKEIVNVKTQINVFFERSKLNQDKGSGEKHTKAFLMVEDRLLKIEKRQGSIEEYTQRFVKRVAEGTPYDQVKNLSQNALSTDPGYPVFQKLSEVDTKESPQVSKVDAPKLSDVRDIALKTQSAVAVLQNHIDMIARQSAEAKEELVPQLNSRIDRLEITLDLQDGRTETQLTEMALSGSASGATSRAGTAQGALPPVIDSARGQSEEDLADANDVRNTVTGHISSISGRASVPLPQRPSSSAGVAPPQRRSLTPSTRPCTTSALDGLNPVSLGAKMKGLELHLQSSLLEKALAPVQKLEGKVTEDLDKKGREIMQLARRVADMDMKLQARSGGPSKRSR